MHGPTFASLLIHGAEVAEDVTWHCVFIRQRLQDDHQLLLAGSDHAARCEAPHHPVHAAVHCTPSTDHSFSAAPLQPLVLITLQNCYPPLETCSSMLGFIQLTFNLFKVQTKMVPGNRGIVALSPTNYKTNYHHIR